MHPSRSVKAYYAQKAPFSSLEEGPILVAQADGKGVSMVRRETANLKVSVHPLPQRGGGLGWEWRGRQRNTLHLGRNLSPGEMPPSPDPSLPGRGERLL